MLLGTNCILFYVIDIMLKSWGRGRFALSSNSVLYANNDLIFKPNTVIKRHNLIHQDKG